MPRLREAGLRPEAVREWATVADAGSLTVEARHLGVRCRSIDESTGAQYEVKAVVHLDGKMTIESWEEQQPL